MSQIGYFIRNNRVSKNLTLQELSDGIVTKSFLSKFERGESDISSDNLMKILDRLNISLFELNSYLTEINNNNQREFLKSYTNAWKEENLSLLKAILKKENELYRNNKNIRHKHNSIIVSQRIQKLSKKKFETHNINQITDYLFSINEWLYYEITLFSNSLFFLPTEKILILSSNIIKKAFTLTKNRTYQHEIVILITNIILNFIRRDKLTESFEIINILEKHIHDSTFYYEITRLNFLKGLYWIKKNEILKGTQIANDAIDLMETLHNYTNSKNYRNYLDDIINSLE